MQPRGGGDKGEDLKHGKLQEVKEDVQRKMYSRIWVKG